MANKCQLQRIEYRSKTSRGGECGELSTEAVDCVSVLMYHEFPRGSLAEISAFVGTAYPGFGHRFANFKTFCRMWTHISIYRCLLRVLIIRSVS